MKVLSIKHLEDFKIEIAFSDKTVKHMDFREFLSSLYNKQTDNILDSIEAFKQVRISQGHLTWGNHEIDLPAKRLYEWREKIIIDGRVFTIGDCVIAFNGEEYQRSTDKEDPGRFYHAAEIIGLRWDKPEYTTGDWVADIRWKNNYIISKNHYLFGLLPC
jgi:hypothetical protein